MARFKAKRHVIRSALLELERVGLVVRRPNRGAMVREFTVTEVNDIYDFRAELHRLAVARMPLPFRNDVLSNLTAITHAHRQAIGADNLSEVIVQNNLFHDTLFDQCGNSYITESIRQHAGLSHAIRSYRIADPDLLKQAADEHDLMIEAARAGERDLLGDLCVRHIEPSRSKYVKEQLRRDT